MAAPTISVKDVEAIKQIDTDNAGEEEIRIIRLENGGIRITTRADESENESNNTVSQQDNNQ